MRSEYGYNIPGEDTGECWAISAHANGDCTVTGGTYDGVSLSSLYREHRELFGNSKEEVFPLLIKIIDAKADLSIQVHPDDTYANVNENGALGKTECWYILDCDEDATIVIGHNAKDKAELKSMIEGNRWNELISPRPIKKGDFFQITPGTVHAIKEGTLILETQQSSDITYRLYDYGRLQNGKPRELHLEKSMDVITCPHTDTLATGDVVQIKDAKVETLVSCKYYSVKKISLNGETELSREGLYQLFSVISGSGSIDGREIKKGDHFMLPAGYDTYKLVGEMELITSFTEGENN